MKIIKNHGYVLFSLNPSEMAKRLLYNCYQGLIKVWRDLRKLKKVHFTHFHKKIKNCHENYKKHGYVLFLFLKSL
jgi:hypothetical protein